MSSVSAPTVSPVSSVSNNSRSNTSVLVSKALLSRIEYLLKKSMTQGVENAPFRVKCIAGDDKLVNYTQDLLHTVNSLVFLDRQLMS